MPIGTPASRPGSLPAAILASTAAAAARATSGVGVQKAWMCGSSFSMRRRTASVTSAAESFLSLTFAATVDGVHAADLIVSAHRFLHGVKERSGRRRNGPGRPREAAAWRVVQMSAPLGQRP